MSRIRSKPENYDQWVNCGLPKRNWPYDVYRYHESLLKYKIAHPECINMTPDEIDQYRHKVSIETRQKWADTMKKKIESMTDEERAAFNKKKGSFYNNMTPEEKLKHNEVLRKRSQNFWDGMSAEERDRFGKYRESFLNDEQRSERARRWSAGARKWAKEHPEELRANYLKGHEAYMKKFYDNQDFRNKQIHLLRKHNKEYFDSLTPEEYSSHMKKLLEGTLERSGNKEFLTNNGLNQKFENRFNRLLGDRFEFKKEVIVQLDMEIKSWDYLIYKKNHKDPIMYVDLDGSFWHGDYYDYDGVFSSKRRDEQRFKFAKDGVPIVIISNITFTEGFNKMCRILEMLDPTEFVDYRYSEYRKIAFPLPFYSETRLLKDIRLLIDKEDKMNSQCFLGESWIFNFHRSIWMESVDGYPSPLQSWSDESILKKMIYTGELNRELFDRNKITQGFNISEFAPMINILSPFVAKSIISRYLKNSITIFDPFISYSSIMIAAVSLKRSYIGISNNVRLWKENLDIIRFMASHQSDLHLQNDLLPLAYRPDDPNITKEHANLCAWIRHIYGDVDQVLSKCISVYSCNNYVFICEDKPEEFPVVEVIETRRFGRVDNLYVVVL